MTTGIVFLPPGMLFSYLVHPWEASISPYLTIFLSCRLYILHEPRECCASFGFRCVTSVDTHRGWHFVVRHTGVRPETHPAVATPRCRASSFRLGWAWAVQCRPASGPEAGEGLAALALASPGGPALPWQVWPPCWRDHVARPLAERIREAGTLRLCRKMDSPAGRENGSPRLSTPVGPFWVIHNYTPNKPFPCALMRRVVKAWLF